MTSVDALLTEAAQATSLLLTCRGIRRLEAPGETFREILGSLNEQPAGRDIISSPEDLGHAPDWIDAGSVYEELVADRGSADFIFCLDPWAAQLLSRANEAAPEAKWILVSNLDQREGGYWQDLERWCDSLPWTAVVSRSDWDRALDLKKIPETAALHAHQQGAWQWKTIAPPTPEWAIVFQVRYSGSFPHLKVFLESLARQKDPVACRIVVQEPSDDLRRYLRWHAIAHPHLKIDLVATLDEAALEVDDHMILPPSFAGKLSASTTLSPEVTAHILTGNLDPFAHYEKLAGNAAVLRLGDLS